jgi:hypothetical protein
LGAVKYIRERGEGGRWTDGERDGGGEGGREGEREREEGKRQKRERIEKKGAQLHHSRRIRYVYARINGG